MLYTVIYEYSIFEISCIFAIYFWCTLIICNLSKRLYGFVYCCQKGAVKESLAPGPRRQDPALINSNIGSYGHCVQFVTFGQYTYYIPLYSKLLIYSRYKYLCALIICNDGNWLYSFAYCCQKSAVWESQAPGPGAGTRRQDPPSINWTHEFRDSIVISFLFVFHVFMSFMLSPNLIYEESRS